MCRSARKLRAIGRTPSPESKNYEYLCPHDDFLKVENCDLTKEKCADMPDPLKKCPVSCSMEIFKKLDPTYTDKTHYEFLLDLHLSRDDGKNLLGAGDVSGKLRANADSYARFCAYETGYFSFDDAYDKPLAEIWKADPKTSALLATIKSSFQNIDRDFRIFYRNAKKTTPAKVTDD